MVLLYLAIQCTQSEGLIVLGEQERVGYMSAFAGGVIILAAGIGSTAVSQKSEALGFVVSSLNLTVLVRMAFTRCIPGLFGSRLQFVDREEHYQHQHCG